MSAAEHVTAGEEALAGAQEKATGSPAAAQRVAEAHAHFEAAHALAAMAAVEAAHGVSA